MNRTLLLSAALIAALPLVARDVTAQADSRATPRPFYTDGFFRVGYAADPVVGGEDAALRCRRAGAWTFRTSKCDDKTLEFLHRYGLRIVLVPEGDMKTCVSALTRIGKGPYADVIGGVQLGSDPTGGTAEDLAKWRAVAGAVRRSLPKAAVALPVRDEKSEIVAKLTSAAPGITHLIVDLTDAPAPYGRLDRISRALRVSPNKALQRLKLWAVAPGEAKAAKGALEVAWRMHWVFSAFAVERTDGVFFAREYGADDFGLVMRHLWATARVHPHLMGHGEGAAVEVQAQKKERKDVATPDDMDLESSDALAIDDLEEAVSAGFAPQACANVAEGRAGDLEYLVFAQDPGVADDKSQMCVAVVNTTGEPVKLGVKLKSRTGFTGWGYWRQMKPDPETGAFSNLTFPRAPRDQNQFVETIAPGEISFLDFRVL